MGTKNKILINDNIHHKYINKNDLDYYLKLGWNKGATQQFKDKISKISKGIARNPELENLRREKISNSMKKILYVVDIEKDQELVKKDGMKIFGVIVLGN